MEHTPELEFAERIGRLFEEAGSSRISGRIVGWLMICEPAEQSQPELVETLGVSKASVSTELRTLMHLGLIERTTRPGDRRSYYRVAEEAWTQLIRRRMQMIEAIAAAAVGGLASIPEATPQRRRRLERLRDVYTRMGRAMTEALADIEAQLAAEQATPKPRSKKASNR
jgi:DNA-binding transcriptional regulator GbsR (MarR family)